MKIFNAIRSAAKDFSDDECMVSGAALAYYTIFALPPLLVIVFVVAEAAGVPQQTVDQIVKEQLGMPVAQSPGQSGQSGGGTLEEVAGREGQKGQGGSLAGLGIVSRIIGIALLVFSATGLFAQLQYALNRAWEVAPDPERGGVMNLLVKRGLSLGMVVVIAFLLLVSFVLTTFVKEAVGWIQGVAPSGIMEALGFGVDYLVTFLVATLLFAAMFKILPDAKTSWRDLWVGAAMTALLFVVGKSLVGWYLGSSDIGSSWGGAASSMIAMLVWVYYTSLIVLFGAELAQVWATEYGGGIEPARGAVRKVAETRLIRPGEEGDGKESQGHRGRRERRQTA
jgi:membrane protein